MRRTVCVELMRLQDAQRSFDGLVKDKNSQIKVLFSNL